MHPATKNHLDIGADDPVADHSHRDGENEDTARQEYKQDADINTMLTKFGIIPKAGTPIYGEWDDTLELQVALMATREAQNAWKDLPEDLKQRFGNMETLLAAVENGQLTIVNKEAPTEPTTTPTAAAPTQ